MKVYEHMFRSATRLEVAANLEKVHSRCRWDGLRCALVEFIEFINPKIDGALNSSQEW